MKSSEYIALKKKEREEKELTEEQIIEQQGKEETKQPDTINSKAEDTPFIIEGRKLYTFLAVCLVSTSIISYNAYTAHQEARKANTQLTRQKASTGAKIEALMNKREENRKKWSEMEKEQDKLNESTEKIEEELSKLNISVIR